MEPDGLTNDFMVDVLAYSVNREVVSFDTCEAAWHHISSNESADIIISETDMDGMSGLKLLDQIKTSYPEKKCILMSSKSEHEQKARELGADGFLAKPFSVEDLFELVQLFVVESNLAPAEYTMEESS